MQWMMGRIPNVKAVIDRYKLYERTVNRNVQKMRGAGTPCTFWRNMSVTEEGIFPQDAIKCYCWTTPQEGGGTTDIQEKQPDRKHFLCSGTGVIDSTKTGSIGEVVGGGYQKYGYREHIISTPSPLTLSSTDLVISGTRRSAYILSGTFLSAELTTDRFPLINFMEVDYLLINDSTDPDQNRVEYEYSLNDIDWVPLTIADWSVSPIANKYADLSLPEGEEFIRFRIRLRKRYSTSPSPKWNSIRFRYRNHRNLNVIDPTFSNIDMPAFLAAREQQSTVVEQSSDGAGWVTRFPLKFWVLPDAAVENADVIRFLQGTFANQTFETSSVIKYTYGEHTSILHRDFEAKLVRDGNDLLGILDYLL